MVLGQPHSGTTMTMGILEILGVDIANSKGNNRKELQGVFMLIHRLNFIAKSNEEKAKLVRNELSQYFPDPKGLWGFKAITANSNLACWLEAFPNVKIVYIYRKSEPKHSPSFKWLDRQNKYKLKLYDQLKSFPKTKILELNYDKIVDKPLEECQKIADFIGVKFSKDSKQKINKFVIRKKN